MPDPLKTELPHHVEAFEKYWALGDRRTYAALAEQANLDLDTIKLWGRSFGWTSRVRERTAEAARLLADKYAEQQVESADRNLRIVRAALIRLARAIGNGDIKPRLTDLERLIRLEDLLMGRMAEGTSPEISSMQRGVQIYLPHNQRDSCPEVE